MSANRPMNTAEWSMLLTLSVLWGGSFFFVELVVDELPTLTVVVARVVVAAAVLHLLLAWRAEPWPRDARIFWSFAAMGLLNNAIPFSLIVWGQAQITAGLASILNAMTPIFGVLVAHAMTADEKLSPTKLVGVLLGLTGVIVMTGPAALAGIGIDLAAQFAILAAAFSYALAGVFGRRFNAIGVVPLTAAAGTLTASALLLLPVMLITDRPWNLPPPSAQSIIALSGLAVLSTALAYILYFRILASVGAVNLLLVTFLIPVSAIALGVLFLGERLEPQELAGAALIALGLAAIDGRYRRWLRRVRM